MKRLSPGPSFNITKIIVAGRTLEMIYFMLEYICVSGGVYNVCVCVMCVCVFVCPWNTLTWSHTDSIFIQNLVYTQLKWTTNNRDLRQRKTAAWNEKHGRSIVLGKEMSSGLIWRSPERVLSERKGKVIPCQGAKDGKGTGTNTGKSGARNLEAESIRSRAESMGGCVKLKTLTEIRWNSVCIIHL